MNDIDVVVPCYNYGRYLAQCVRSVLEQRGVGVRVLIIDDCSSDDTPVVANALVKQDGRVHFRRHSANRGHIATYNEGLLEWASAEYALLISADDIVARGAFARAARVLRAVPAAGMCYGHQLTFSGERPRPSTESEGTRPFEVVNGHAFIERACEAGGNPVATPTAIVRTSMQRSIGGYKPQLPHTADLEMWLRFASRGPLVKINALQAYKREHANNMLKQFTPTALPDIEQRKLAFESALADFHATIPDAERLVRQANKSLASDAFWAAHALFESGQPGSCDRLLDFAANLDPSWRTSASWRRLQWKRRMGPKAWRMMSPLVNIFRIRHAELRKRSAYADR